MGAAGLEMACFGMLTDHNVQRIPRLLSGCVDRRAESSRRLDDLIRAQAPRAHAEALDPAVDQRPHRLKIRLEPARADVVRVGMLPTDDGSLAANRALLGHGCPLECTAYSTINRRTFSSLASGFLSSLHVRPSAFCRTGDEPRAQYCIIRLKNTQNSSERRLQSPVV